MRNEEFSQNLDCPSDPRTCHIDLETVLNADDNLRAVAMPGSKSDWRSVGCVGVIEGGDGSGWRASTLSGNWTW